jgi:hypothetical protein
MGDISRHRDIFLFSRQAVPTQLLGQCRLTAADLTYLELGNYLTDVSQFRDPVSYIFAKQRIWREEVIPKAGNKALLYRALGALGVAAGVAANQYLADRASGVLADVSKYGGPAFAVLSVAPLVLPSDLYADIGGADEWIDAILGTPLERTPGDPKRQEEKHYGYLGQFFRHFIEGITQLLFAQDVKERTGGEWGQVNPIPETRVTEIFTEFFTQYYPHEHTDQPPYVWDASKRPTHPSKMYQPSRRQQTLKDPDIGVMNAVDVHYVQYLAEELTDLEQQWRALKPADEAGRQRMLVRLGKLLHGIEDWYFHSNVSEILRMRGHTPSRTEAETDDEAFLKRFVEEVAKTEPEFVAAQPADRIRLMRKLYRRLRFPAYKRGTSTESAGVLDREKPSTPSLRHAYPAFPSQQDTAHTLLHALENLEHKVTHPAVGGRDRHIEDWLAKGLPPWIPCVLRKFRESRNGDGRKLLEAKVAARRSSRPELAVVDVLREWVPLVLTLLDESERQRLAEDVDPLEWPIDKTAAQSKRQPGTAQLDRQLELHRAALEPKPTDGGLVENNYERAVRYLTECGSLNARGRQAIVKAFEIDGASQKLLPGAPGAGGFLIQFAVRLQRELDAGDKATVELDRNKNSVFGQRSDNGAFNEIVGSHSLMSKDTVTSTPFFDDTKVLASVASSSVLTIMLEQVSAPTVDRQLAWTEVLHHFIRYPPTSGGWERRAIAFFRQNNGKIPTYADLPELAQLVGSLKRPPPPPAARKQRKRDELEKLYIDLEAKLAKYRYPTIVN